LARPLTTPATATPPVDAPDHAAAGRRWAGVTAKRWGLLLVVGWLIQAGLRAWFSRAQVVPLANPDETAYLIAARVLAGGTPANLSGSTLYQGGYPLLITPVYWFTNNPSTVYHAVMIINAALSALIMPLGFAVCRRLGLDRRTAYGVAMITALVPAGFFYSAYAMTDAIFPVITLAWLLTVHTWLITPSSRARYAAAIGSAVLGGYAYTVHSRGLVMLFGYAVVAAIIAWRRPAVRGTVVAAGLAAVLSVGAGLLLNRYIDATIYPQGTRSLGGQTLSTVTSIRGVIHVLEMAGGQAWRLTLDSWGIAAIGLMAAVAAIFRRGLRSDLRVMAALSVGVTILIALIAPAALPSDQSQTWASGRYIDGMIIAFFLVGAIALLRASIVRNLLYAAGATALTVLAAATVAVYAGGSLPTAGFGSGFNFAEPAVLTQNWNSASVLLATAVALGLLGFWILCAFVVRRWSGLMQAGGLVVFGVAVAAVSLVALAQMTSHVSRAGTSASEANMIGIVQASGLKPGDQVAFASDLPWELAIPQTYEIWWMQPQYFNPAQSPPAGVTVAETVWPSGQPASASWADAPAGWRIVATGRVGGWVVWRKS
jgi:Dolichyl-phosphate-mannose-protein mannosyltransferase